MRLITSWSEPDGVGSIFHFLKRGMAWWFEKARSMTLCLLLVVGEILVYTPGVFNSWKPF